MGGKSPWYEDPAQTGMETWHKKGASPERNSNTPSKDTPTGSSEQDSSRQPSPTPGVAS